VLYVILQKYLDTDIVSVHSIYDDETLVEMVIESLIEGADEETVAYKMQVVGSSRVWIDSNMGLCKES
jgi:hypothetical protein